MPKCQLQKIITRKRFLEQKMRFGREPWGSKAQNGQFLITLEMLRKAITDRYKNFGPEMLEKYAYSKTSEERDRIMDLRLDPDANDFEMVEDGKEAREQQFMFAGLMAKYT